MNEITRADVAMNNVLVRGRRDVINNIFYTYIYAGCYILMGTTLLWIPTHPLPWLGRNIKAVVPAKASPKASPKRASVPKAKAKAKVRSGQRTRVKKTGKAKAAKEEDDE